MNIKKFFVWSSITIGILVILFIALLIYNNETASCKEGHRYNNETNTCYYFGEKCGENEKVSYVDEARVCIYAPIGFLNSNLMTGLLIFLGVGWAIIFIIYIINVGKSLKPMEISEFRKEDFVGPNRAKDLWTLMKCQREHITIIDGVPDNSKFNFYYASEPFKRGREWFLKFQCEILDGDHPGIFTVITSLSRGEKWILNGGAREKNCTYSEFKVSREMPLYTPENPEERMLEQLWITHPERAMELQEQLAEKRIVSPGHEEPLHEEAEGVPQQMPVRRQPYRRYPKRLQRRGYYG